MDYAEQVKITHLVRDFTYTEYAWEWMDYAEQVESINQVYDFTFTDF